MYVSIRRFAKLDGCSEGLVRRGIREGKLKAEPGGKLDPALAKSDWRRSNAVAKYDAHKARTGVRTVLEGETLEQAAERAVEHAVTIPAVGVSIAKRAFYEAELKALEHDLKIGTVVLVADAAQSIGEQLADVRRRLLAIPSEVSTQVHRLKTVPEIAACLTDAIRGALIDLTGDTLPAPG